MKFAESARADLEEIYDYIAADDVNAADTFVHLLLDACSDLDRTPGIGHRRSDLTASDVLFWSLRGYVIVYRKLKLEVQIVAVTQGSQDIRRLLRRRRSIR